MVPNFKSIEDQNSDYVILGVPLDSVTHHDGGDVLQVATLDNHRILPSVDYMFPL